MERKFSALRVIALVLKLIAWIQLILFVIGFVVSLMRIGMFMRFGGGMSAIFLIAGIMNFLILYCWAETIHLFLSMEENLRKIADK